MDDKLALLARVPLFAGIEPDDLAKISRIAEEVDARPGTVLTHEGRHEGYFFVIVSGTVRIDRGGQTINTIADGDFLGEIALLDGGPRTASATAVTNCRLLRLTLDRFDELMDTSPAIRRAIFAEFGDRLRRLDVGGVH
jgi:CRP/FNR family transcriptional regulator, cyclic AMP receptor protein